MNKRFFIIFTIIILIVILTCTIMFLIKEKYDKRADVKIPILLYHNFFFTFKHY